jgi:hypothetical protein
MRNCPDCGGQVRSALTCHTYPGTWKGKETWLSCMPCDSATWWFCEAHNEERCFSDCYEYDDHEGCGWSWTEGLNPRNPRAEKNEKKNPHWED